MAEKKWPSATDPNPGPEPEGKTTGDEVADVPLGATQPHINPHSPDAPAPTSPVAEPPPDPPDPPIADGAARKAKHAQPPPAATPPPAAVVPEGERKIRKDY